MHLTNLEQIELERLRARVGRLFAALQEAAEMLTPQLPGAWLPPVDLSETEAFVKVVVEVPGVRPEHVEVTIKGTQLSVRGRKKKGAPRGVLTHLCSERSYGQFTRVIPLRWPIRASEATAELKDGLLTVLLPKIDERRGGGFKVPVKAIASEE